MNLFKMEFLHEGGDTALEVTLSQNSETETAIRHLAKNQLVRWQTDPFLYYLSFFWVFNFFSHHRAISCYQQLEKLNKTTISVK